MVFIYGGVLGIGIMVIMLVKVFGVLKVMIIVGLEVYCEVSLCFGVNYVINYWDEDFVEKVNEFMNGNGVDVIFDIIVGDYVVCNYMIVVMNGCIL